MGEVIVGGTRRSSRTPISSWPCRRLVPNAAALLPHRPRLLPRTSPENIILIIMSIPPIIPLPFSELWSPFDSPPPNICDIIIIGMICFHFSYSFNRYFVTYFAVS